MDSKRKSGAGELPMSQSPSKKQKETLPPTFLDASVLQAAFDKGVVTQWEHGFYNDIIGKESLSVKQIQKKDLVELKVDMTSAKAKNVVDDFEYKFAIDNCGKALDALSEKQQAIKKRIDEKMSVWRAFQTNAIDDWDLKFMTDISKRETCTPKQLPIKARIEKQLEAAAAVMEGQVLNSFEAGFLKDNIRKEKEALSEKQRPIMDRIEKKLQAWRAYKAGLINQWSLDFIKDVAGRESLSEKQQKKLSEIEEAMGHPAE